MLTVVSNKELRKFMGTTELHQFQEEVLINNIKVLYPDATDITIHTHEDGRIMAIVMIGNNNFENYFCKYMMSDCVNYNNNCESCDPNNNWYYSYIK